ncbi:MAG TPA: DNA polymerase III subunit chi [Gammaproteobacteria bacterium]|nr:DNA polymerase III subunit chi [Gammaproteobacteria bacterium]
MPKIDFYILPETTATARLQFACRLIEKAYKQKHRIYVHTADRAAAHQLDEILWTYRDDSFLPHNLYGDGPEPAPPIQIGFETVPEKHRDILINLHGEVPEFHKQFARIFELILNENNSQESGRERYRFYRSQQFEINTHKLQSSEINHHG